jgi:hypothetical protein
MIALIVISTVLGGIACGIIGYNNAGIGGAILGIIIGALGGGYGITGLVMALVWLWDNSAVIALAIALLGIFILIIFSIIQFWGVGIH